MIGFFTRHPTAANLLMLVVVVLGLVSLPKLRRETFPDPFAKEVEIRVVYPGATADDVEEAIVQRIEDAIDGVRFVQEVRSDARQNVATVTVEMVEGGNWQAFKDEIDTAVAAIDDFPDQAEDAVVEELHTIDNVMTILVAGDMTPGDLKLYAEDLKDRMLAEDDIGLVRVTGFSDHQLRVELNARLLRRYRLSADDVVNAIRQQNIDVPAGIVESDDEEVLVRFDDERQTAEQLADLVVVGAPDGTQLRVRDLGRVVDTFETAENRAVFYKPLLESTDEAAPAFAKNRIAILQVQKTDTEDVLVVADAVDQFLERERIQRPAVDLIVTQNQSTLVRDRLSLLITNGWQGMILVFIAMWLFFNAKLSLWVVASLPVSFLGAFFFLPPLDVSINMLSLVGLLLGIGILMDDGIVIAENIAAQRERGKSPMQAAIDGVSQVSGGVISSFLTTACVLGPLMFLAGQIGRILNVVPVILLLVLAVSLIEAFMILPNHLSHSLRDTDKVGRFRRKIDDAFAWVRENVLGRGIDLAVRWRYLWLGCVVAIFLCSLALPISGTLPFSPLPELDGDTAVARVLMPQGTPLDRTEQVADRLCEAVFQLDRELSPRQPEGQQLVTAVYAKFNENADAVEVGPHVVTVYADLLTSEKRTVTLDEIYERWRELTGPVVDAVSVNYTAPAIGPSGRNIDIRVSGQRLNEIRETAIEIQTALAGYRGVENLTPNLRPGRHEYRLRFRPGALGINMNSQRMANQLRAAFNGQTAVEIQVGGESYEIEARFDDVSQDSIADLQRFRFTQPDGTQVPLSSVATIEETRGWSRIARIDGVRTASVLGDVDSRYANTAAVLADFQANELTAIQARHPEVRITLDGENAEAAATGKSLVQGMVLGVVGVFVLLSFQFRSYVEPVVVMAAIPFALIGVLWGHLLMGFPMTMPSMLGFVSLAGIVVNDSILLVLFLKEARKNGADPVEAAGQASRERFRAITITSLTTMAGLVPLMFETSLQAVILIPLAISIVFGMATSTVLVLLVIPCLYVMLDDFGLTASIDNKDESPPLSLELDRSKVNRDLAQVG